MSTSAGPNIVEDGLVLSLDAANPKSFRGEPTTNLLPQPLSFETGYTRESWTGTITDNYAIAPDGTQTATLISRSGGYFYKRNTISPTFSISPGDTITFSCWVKKNDNSTTTGKGISIWSYSLGSQIRTWSTDEIYNDRWTRLSTTYTAIDGETNFAFIFVGNQANQLDGSILIWHPQVEIKPYATDFVVGSRGSTVETGGGWADLSSSSNHGTISGSPLYSYPNNGGILIDSADDYFDLASPSSLPAGSSDRTIISFVKTPSSLSGFQHVFHYGTAAQDQSFGLALYAGKLSTHPWVGTPTSDATLQPSTIYGLAVAYRQSDSKHLFWINGIKDSSEPVRAINTGSTTARVGSRISTAVEGWIPNGQIYNVFIYNRVLSDSEIAQNFNALRGRYGI